MTFGNFEPSRPMRAVESQPAVHDLEGLLTVNEVAALLKVSKSWVY